jgi:tetratricopeptide (TPR) repeat protein
MIGNTLLDDLQRQIDAGQVVAIVGAGVSVGATKGNPVASWQGLLHHGVDRCLALSDLTDAGATLLHGQIDSEDLDMMLAAAEVISRKLGAPKGGEWRRWLRETVGALRAEQRGVIEALRALGITIATTNYDGLIEEVTGLPPVTWRDGAIVERVLRGEEEGVLHLHGFWDDPESVVLGVRDYEKVLGDANAQTMQRAMRSLNTLLFVGCGEGLADPNFGALLRWSEGVFAGSEYRHFRLARDVDRSDLQDKHPAEQRIFVLGYGPDFGDLAGFLRDLRPAAKAGAPSSPTASPAPAAALPPAPICFGRDDEIADLVVTLIADKPDPTTILGPAGIGKSTITLVALNDPRVAERYGARRYFIRCDAVRTREAFAAAIATALGLPITPQVEAAVMTELASVPAVLAIDNAETPWEADTLRVEGLFAQLAAVPGLALVASLRGYSRPMGVRWRASIEPRSLPLDDARHVFLAIAGQQFANDADLDRLLRALDGVPLAITLMANAAEGQPDLKDTWRRWEDERTKMLQRAGGTDRLLNIEASYEISIQGPRMTDEARRLLAILGFLPGGVARGDIDAIYPGHGTRAAAVLRQVGLAFDEADRLRLLAPLREYVQREHLPDTDDLQTSLQHFNGLALLGEKAGKEGGAEAIARLIPEIENIENTIERLLDRSESDGVIEAAISLGQFARLTGLGTTAPLRKAVQVAHTLGGDRLVARCRARLGDIAFARSDYESARTQYEQAFPLFKGIGDILGETNCIRSLGDIALRSSDHERARARYEEALPLYRGLSDNLGEANCIHRLGEIAFARSDHESARTRYEEALLLYRRVGDILGEATCILNLGDIARRRSNNKLARARYEHALALYGRIPEPYSMARTYRSLALVSADERERRQHVGAARDAWQSIGRDDLVAELVKEFGVE